MNLNLFILKANTLKIVFVAENIKGSFYNLCIKKFNAKKI